MIALLSRTVDGARRRAEAIAGSGDEEEAALADRAKLTSLMKSCPLFTALADVVTPQPLTRKRARSAFWDFLVAQSATGKPALAECMGPACRA